MARRFVDLPAVTLFPATAQRDSAVMHVLDLFIQEYGRVPWNEVDESPITESLGRAGPSLAESKNSKAL
jgi:hypothetical protein